MLSALILTALLGAGGAAEASPCAVERAGIRVTGLAPAPGQKGTLGFSLGADWLKGQIVLRCPETLSSPMGLHFIDHERADMPQLSDFVEPVRWHSQAERGVLSYTARTPEGLVLQGTAELAYDGAWISLRIENNTQQTLTGVNSQMCLILDQAPGLGIPRDLSGTFTWLNGDLTTLDKLTPTAAEKGRAPWILMPTAERRKNYQGATDLPGAWWVADQTADHPLLARRMRDGNGLAGIAWCETASMLMTNSNLPCLHAGPETRLDIEVGQSATWRGKVYLTQHTPKKLFEQFQIDQAQQFMRHDLVVCRELAPGAASPAGESVRAAAVRVVWGFRDETAEAIVDRGFRLAEDAVRQGAKLIVLPENFLHSSRDEDQLVPDGALVKRTEEFARSHSVYVCSGIIESWKFDWRDTYDTYLSAIVVGPEGYLSKHRKVDVNNAVYDRNWRPGAPKTDLGVWAGEDFAMHVAGPVKRLGIMICRDTDKSWAWSRVLTQNPQIIASPNLRDSVTKYGADFGAMAARYGVPMIVATGHPESESFIVNRRGEVVAFINGREGVIVADVELAPHNPALTPIDVIHNTFAVIPEH